MTQGIWNPWHGCVKKSEGCANCYMYCLDAMRDRDGSEIYRVKTNFDLPLKKNRVGEYKIRSGEFIKVCMTSDFFLEEADAWRDEVWDIIRARPDVVFQLITKRPERIEACLPNDWGDGWPNVMCSVSTENQKRADERVPILLDMPFVHRGVNAAPLLDEVSLKGWLGEGAIEQVIIDGENYDGMRVCRYEWVRQLHDECVEADVTCAFIGCGRRFEKDGIMYAMETRTMRREQAYLSGLSHRGREILFHLKKPVEPIHKVSFGAPSCQMCGSRIICGGCYACGRCGYKG